MFALTNHRCSREHDREQRKLVDDGHDAREPCRDAVRVEHLALNEVHGPACVDIRSLEIGREALSDDVMDVAGADACLLHGGRVDVYLDVRLTSGFQIPFKLGGNHDDEHEASLVHGSLHFVGSNPHWILKAWWIE